jgi:quercetin dioxygenase-like cupin family protein
MQEQQPAGARAGYVLGPDEGEAFHWLGSLTVNKVGATATAGGLSIVDHRVPPGYAPPAHRHADDEVFYILEGDFRVRCGDQSWQAGPGSLVFLPRDVPHGFTVSQDGPGRTLLILAPGGFDEVVSELGTPTGELRLPGPDVPVPDRARLDAVAAAHRITPVPGY